MLALLIPFSWWAAETHHLNWHRWSGYTVIAVLVFRIYWGLFGAETARFAHFVRGPGAILAYLRGRAAPRLGHSPLGALSVIALLACLVVQVSLGLFSVDIDGFESGPLSDRVSFDQGRLAAGLHHINFNILLGLVALHLIAIAVYAVRRRNLVGPMITGRQSWDGVAPKAAPVWRILPGLALALFVALFIMEGARFSMLARRVAALVGAAG
jgi:cytochrome b